MPSGLKHPDVIDLVLRSKDGSSLDLVVLDHGDVSAPAERLQAVQRKLVSCANFVADGAYRQHVQGAAPRSVFVRFVCATEPTEQMRNLAAINVTESDGRSTSLQVTVEQENEFRSRVAKELGVMPPQMFNQQKKWWQIWR